MAYMSWLARIMRTVTTALARYEMVTPASSRTKMSIRPRRRAAIHTMPRVSEAADEREDGRPRQVGQVQHDADGGAERGARRDAGDVRVGERVEEEVLQDDAGHRQLRPDEAGDEHARQADLPEDRVGQVALDRPRGHEVPELAERQRGRSEGEREQKAHDEDAAGQGDARPDACARQTRHCAAYASGWIILASSCRPCGQARAGPGDRGCRRSRTRARP